MSTKSTLDSVYASSQSSAIGKKYKFHIPKPLHVRDHHLDVRQRAAPHVGVIDMAIRADQKIKIIQTW